jgi:hypothetical protein
MSAMPNLEPSELPVAIVDSIVSWRRVWAKANVSDRPSLLQQTAADLFHARKVNRTVWPASDGFVNQAIVDALADMAVVAGIADDDAQLIFAQAERGDCEAVASSADGQRWQKGSFTARELQRRTFPVLSYVLPGLIAEGVTILAGKPKVARKTWFMLDLGVGVANNTSVLGNIRPDHGDVLGIFLEDNDRRLQRRLDKLLPTFSGEWPERLTLKTSWPRLNEGGLEDIQAWCEAVAAPRLIIIDTLAKIRPISKGNAPPYETDYLALGDLQSMALERHIAIVVIHHLRKADADDVFDTVSGTHGLTGAADTTIIITRTGSGTVLHAIGRDIEETEKAIEFNADTCRYTILGEAAEVHRSDERKTILSVLRNAREPLSPKEIASGAGMKDGNVRFLLHKMTGDGEVEKASHGRYVASTPLNTANTANSLTME